MSPSMLWLLVTVALLVIAKGDQAHAQASGTRAAQQQPIIEVRYGRDTPAPGFAYMAGVFGNHRGAYVARDNIVSDAGIERVYAERTAEGLMLDVELSKEASARWESAIKSVGAMKMALLIKSRLVSVVPVASPPAGSSRVAGPEAERRRITIDLDLPASFAAEVAASIAARWPQ